MSKKKKNNYINNKDFFNAMVEYKKRCVEAEDAGDEPPIIPDYIGKCFMDISNRLAYRPNFINYPFREELVADGIENAIIACKNFDPEKSENPFGYFTQIIWFAFLRRIEKEKKELYVKHKVVENSMMMGTAIEQSNHSDDGGAEYIDLTSDYMNDFVETFEKNMEKKKKKREAKKEKEGLEKFYDEEDDNED